MAKLLGKAPNQVPTNADLGSMAFQDREGINVNTAVVANLVVTGATSVNTTFAVTNATSNVAFFASNGNIGFGTSAPTWPLQVNANAAYFGAFNTTGGTTVFVDSPTAQTASIVFRQGGGNAVDLGTRKSNNSVFTIRETASGVERITFVANSTAGALGINNTAPDATLAVTGTANISGNVVIGGTISVNGVFTANSTKVQTTGPYLTVGGSIGAGETNITIGDGRTASGFAYIDLVGDTTYIDYGLRMIRGNSGPNATSGIQHKGTGNFAIQTEEAGALTFLTTSVQRAVITATGNVGISNTAPDATLAVTGTANISGNVVIGGSATIAGNLTVSGTTTYINTTTLNVGDNIITLNADLPGATAPTESAGWEVNRGSSANVSFVWDETNQGFKATSQSAASGTSLIINNLFGESNKDLLFNYNDSSQVGMIRVYGRPTTPSNGQSMSFWLNDSTALQQRMTLAANGNFGIGNTTPAHTLSIGGNAFLTGNVSLGNTDHNYSKLSISDSTGAWMQVIDSGASTLAIENNTGASFFRTEGSNASFVFSTGGTWTSKPSASTGTVQLIIAANGNFGIGNTTPAQKLVVAGSTTLTSGDLSINNGFLYFGGAQTTPSISKSSGNTTQSYRLDIPNLGGPTGVNAGAFWNGLHLTSPPGITNATSGSAYPRMSAFYSYTSNTAPTDLTFNMWTGNDSGLGTAIKLYSTTLAGTAGGIDIAANGNIGIGNTTPANKLTVTGNTYIDGERLFLYSATSNTGPFLQLYTANTASYEAMRFLHPGGNVAFDAGYDTGAQSYYVNRFDTSGTFVDRSFMIGRANGNISIGGNVSPTEKLSVTGTMSVANATTTGVLFVAANGNIGINTTAPTAKFFISSDAGTSRSIRYDSGTQPSFRIRNNDNGIPTSFQLENWGLTGTGQGASITATLSTDGVTPYSAGQIIFTNEGDYLSGANAFAAMQFRTSSANNLGVKMHIGANGNIGIGNTSPINKLSVAGDIKASQSITIGNGGGNYQAGSLYSDGNWGMIIRSAQASPATAQMSFHDASDTRLMTIYANNNMSIGSGNTTPTNKLTVDGNIYSNNLRRYTQTRALSTTVNDTIEIGTLYSQHGAHSINVTLQTTDGGFSTAKRYEISSYFGATGSTVYRKVLPLFDTGPFSTNDYDLEAYHNTETIGLRLRRTAGSNSGTVEILIDDLLLQSEGQGLDYFTPSSTTATGVAAVTDVFPGSRVINTGVGHATPNTFIVQANLTTAAITSNNTITQFNLPVVFGGSYTTYGTAGQTTINFTTSATTANQVVSTAVGLGSATWRTVKYLVSVTSGSAYQATEITLIHDGTNVYKTEYGQVFSGAVLATFDADINSGNIRLLTTPTNAVTTYKGTVTFVSV